VKAFPGRSSIALGCCQDVNKFIRIPCYGNPAILVSPTPEASTVVTEPHCTTCPRHIEPEHRGVRIRMGDRLCASVLPYRY